jgi:hypothetical protein
VVSHETTLILNKAYNYNWMACYEADRSFSSIEILTDRERGYTACAMTILRSRLRSTSCGTHEYSPACHPNVLYSFMRRKLRHMTHTIRKVRT